MRSIILASTSPYRKELLSRLGVLFTVEDPGVDESSFKRPGLPPRELAGLLAQEKARAVHRRNPEAIVIGSDQVVAIAGTLLGKPGDRTSALSQLQLLRGRTHELITAVTLLGDGEHRHHTEVTRLHMGHFTDDALERYLASDKPYDCAGSYKIEGQGICLFKTIEGEDHTAIQGFPLIAVSRLLRELGVELP